MRKEVGIQSIVRVLGVMEALNQRNVSSVDAIHTATGLPKPTLVRILTTLAGAGYIFHVSRRDGYVLTEKVLRLSAGFRYHDAIVDVARPLLEAFTEKHKWQLSIATLDANAMRVRFNTRHLSPFSPEHRFLNRRLGMLNSALGRAYLAYSSDIERHSILKLVEAAYPADGPRFPGAEELDRLLGTIRDRGYATAEREPGDPIRSFAVPVLAGDVRGGVLGSIALFYFASVMTESQAAGAFLDEVQAIGRQVGDALKAMYEDQVEKAAAPMGVSPGRGPADYAGKRNDSFQRIEELELENARLRRAVSDLALDKQILTERVLERAHPAGRNGRGRVRPV